jgi:hypothetical protein
LTFSAISAIFGADFKQVEDLRPGAKAARAFCFPETLCMSVRRRTKTDAAANGAAALPAKVGRGNPPVEHRFKPGNPGRPKGSRNKLGEHFIAALCVDFEEHGASVIERVREDDPAVYLRVVAQIVPQTVLVSDARLDDLTDDELAAYLAAVREALRVREGAIGAQGVAMQSEQDSRLLAVPDGNSRK